jgi:hypothetical protein
MQVLAASLLSAAIVLPVVASATSDNWYASQAKKEARDCIDDAKEPGFTVVAQTHVVSACFASGFITEVSLYKTVTCHKEPCGRPAATLLATVEFGCDDEVTWAECHIGGACNYEGEIYDEGESFDAIDDCNTCSCDASGAVACTEMACI